MTAKPSIHDVLHNFVINEPYSVTEIEFVIPKMSQMKGFLVVFPVVCLYVLIGLGFNGFQSDSMRCVAMPLVGRPAFPFIGQGKAHVIVEGKEENEKEKKSSRIVGSFFSFTRVMPTL